MTGKMCTTNTISKMLKLYDTKNSLINMKNTNILGKQIICKKRITHVCSK